MRKTAERKRPYASLKAWREAHDLDTFEAAKALGVSEPKYRRWERGERFPKGPEALFVMQTTHVPLETLLGGA